MVKIIITIDDDDALSAERIIAAALDHGIYLITPEAEKGSLSYHADNGDFIEIDPEGVSVRKATPTDLVPAYTLSRISSYTVLPAETPPSAHTPVLSRALVKQAHPGHKGAHVMERTFDEMAAVQILLTPELIDAEIENMNRRIKFSKILPLADYMVTILFDPIWVADYYRQTWPARSARDDIKREVHIGGAFRPGGDSAAQKLISSRMCIASETFMRTVASALKRAMRHQAKHSDMEGKWEGPYTPVPIVVGSDVFDVRGYVYTVIHLDKPYAFVRQANTSKPEALPLQSLIAFNPKRLPVDIQDAKRARTSRKTKAT